MKVNLKPCPFCGGPAKLIELKDQCPFTGLISTSGFTVRCNGRSRRCLGANIALCGSKTAVINAWNTRMEPNHAESYKCLCDQIGGEK